VESGNITEVSGDWFLADLSVQGQTSVSGPASSRASSRASSSASSPAKAAAKSVDDAVSDLSQGACSDAAPIDFKAAESAAATQSAAQQFRKGLDAVKSVLRSANARIAAIIGTINDLTMQSYLDVAALSGAVIQLAESPGLVAGSVASRISMFVRLGRRIITDLPAAVDFSRDKIAAALTGELWINAVLCGMGTTITESLPETRAESLSILSQYRAFAAESRDALDALAKATAGNPIEDQYFPRASAAEAVLSLNAAINRYVLDVAFDLKTEKRITLERPTSPMLLAIKEYGATAASADAAFDLLCRSNNLHGRELLLLPANREIVIYA
jgi:hypothetical protein